MKTNQASRSSRQGSALLTVMIVVMITTIAAGGLYAFSATTLQRTRLVTESIRAKAIAEAGANRAYTQLNESGLDTSESIYDGVEFAGGDYSVTCQLVGENWLRMVSVGNFGRAQHKVGLDVRFAEVDDGDGDEDAPGFLAAMNYGIFCNGAFVINGTPKNVNGDLHSNGSFALHGTYANVNGKVSAPPPNDVPASHAAPWQNIHFPQLWEPEFKAWLEAQEAAGVSVTRLTGSQTFKKDQTFNGITVIDGSVTFIGSGTRTINGLLYVSGSFTANGSTSLNGSIMVGGSLTINGASAILTYANVAGGGDPVAEEDETEYEIAQEIWWD